MRSKQHRQSGVQEVSYALLTQALLPKITSFGITIAIFAANQGIQIQGACLYTYSDVGPNGISIGPPDPNHNQNNDPKFKDEVSDLHLTPGSPLQLLQQSDPGTNLSDPKDPAVKDIDGELRVAPVLYIGADQYYPPKP
jgi:hypothetical protein